MTVKLRFAPSPTGFIHVGNVRTAVANFLFARQQGGQFLLRLDDTDVERSTDAFAEAIREDMRWLGLDWDETFKQSERQAAYDEAVEKLKAAGRLYACYETPDELDLKRKVQLSRGKPPVYDRDALALSDDEKAAFEAEGRTPHWRFLLNQEHVAWDDLVRGGVSVDCGSLSDPVLIRGDGTLLYTLPSVVDDIDSAITHVVRGEDHVTNTAAQVQVFEAFGAAPPAFAHHPLLTGAGGEGLSKRLGSLSIQDLRAKGLEPMAIVSLLARLGTSDPVEPFAEIDPLVASFDFTKFGRASAKFDEHELETLNAKIVHQLPFEAVHDRLPGIEADMWPVLRPNLTKAPEALDWLTIIHGPVTPVVEDVDFLAAAAGLLPAGDWDDTTWSAWTSAVKEVTGRKGKELFKPLRLALTGLDHGPEMKLLLPLIGIDRVRARLTGTVA